MKKNEEYQKQLDLFMKEEYEKETPKPNRMIGHMGWFAIKEKEFEEKNKNEKI